jgi:hypothetical protein
MRLACRSILTRLTISHLRGKKTPYFFEPLFFGVNLHCFVSANYLRVILDSQLMWRGHVEIKVKNAHNLLWVCRRFFGATKGLKPKVVHWLYIYHLAIHHLCISSLKVLTPDSQCHSWLCKIQRLPCLRITEATHITPASAMEAVTCLPPLDLVVQGKARSGTH